MFTYDLWKIQRAPSRELGTGQLVIRNPHLTFKGIFEQSKVTFCTHRPGQQIEFGLSLCIVLIEKRDSKTHVPEHPHSVPPSLVQGTREQGALEGPGAYLPEGHGLSFPHTGNEGKLMSSVESNQDSCSQDTGHPNRPMLVLSRHLQPKIESQSWSGDVHVELRAQWGGSVRCLARRSCADTTREGRCCLAKHLEGQRCCLSACHHVTPLGAVPGLSWAFPISPQVSCVSSRGTFFASCQPTPCPGIHSPLSDSVASSPCYDSLGNS